MSYDYERYDGKRIVVDGEVIGLLAMEFGHEVEEVWEEYHAELSMTEEQERQSEAYKESLRRALSAQYEKVATLESENARLRDELENARMRGDDLASSIREWRAVTEARGQTIDRLAADNAKLRELVRHMNTCIEHYEPDGSMGCEHCPLDNDTGNCDYERRMRELEVDE